MRVITGRFKGRHLEAVPDRTIRPATDRVKQAVFDVLATRISVEGAQVHDLYAGTGSLGIEALSRGARRCTFVDTSGDSIRCIGNNLEALGCTEAADVVQSDAFRFIAGHRGAFRLIFADPPYSDPLTATLPDAIFGRSLLEPSGYLVIEDSKNVIFGESKSFATAAVKNSR